MKRCAKCSQKAVVYLPHHRIALCKEHYIEWFERRVERTIREFRMFSKDDRVLVAVSGGKTAFPSGMPFIDSATKRMGST